MIDNTGTLKITGFGLAKECKEEADRIENKLFGTPEYLAPETIQKEEKEEEADEAMSGAGGGFQHSPT